MRRLLAPVVALVVAGIVVAAVMVVLNARRPAAVDGLRTVGDAPFGDGNEIDAGATGAVLSGSGRLALVTDDGLGLAEDGEVRPVTEPGSRVVDVAWFGNGATLLVAEGPVPTGGLAVVDADGTVRGTVPLTPSIGFGSGYGMAVGPGGRRAVVTAVDRPALGTEERHLAFVDLETGATRPLTEPGASPQEVGPFFLDEHRVAFTEIAADGSRRPLVLDLRDGSTQEVAPAGPVVGVAGTVVLLLEERDLVAVPVAVGSGSGSRSRSRSKERVVVGEVPAGTSVASIDGRRGEAVVIDRAGRVRRVTVDPVKETS